LNKYFNGDKNKLNKTILIKRLSRKKGKLDAKTLEKLATIREVKERIAKNAQRLLDAQLTLAMGTSYLFCITYEGSGKNKKKVVEQVTDLFTIERYLNGELDGGGSDDEGYFYITAEKPNAIAINDMLNRAFGKPKEEIEIKSKKPLTELVVKIIHANNGDTGNNSAGETSTDGAEEEDNLP
jgi:hypothetical protein